MTDNDPRGPRRKIVSVNEILTPCDEGILLKKEVVLDCGHKRYPNPIYTYTIGDSYRCFDCKKEN